jgi:hypothetical protein
VEDAEGIANPSPSSFRTYFGCTFQWPEDVPVSDGLLTGERAARRVEFHPVQQFVKSLRARRLDRSAFRWASALTARARYPGAK